MITSALRRMNKKVQYWRRNSVDIKKDFWPGLIRKKDVLARCQWAQTRHLISGSIFVRLAFLWMYHKALPNFLLTVVIWNNIQQKVKITLIILFGYFLEQKCSSAFPSKNLQSLSLFHFYWSIRHTIKKLLEVNKIYNWFFSVILHLLD